MYLNSDVSLLTEDSLKLPARCKSAGGGPNFSRNLLTWKTPFGISFITNWSKLEGTKPFGLFAEISFIVLLY